jgi:serine/threonine protein kinase
MPAPTYEMATGKLPFRGESLGDIFDSILNSAPVPPIRLNPDLPAELERIINKCLEKDRNLRYQHASEIRTDLQRLKRDTDSGRMTTSARPAATTGVAKRWKVIVPAESWVSHDPSLVKHQCYPSMSAQLLPHSSLLGLNRDGHRYRCAPPADSTRWPIYWPGRDLIAL